MSYLMVLLVEFYRVDEDTIACESAFATHLKELLPRISEWSDHIVIHSPVMAEETYQKNKQHLAHINCKQEKIYYIEGPRPHLSRLTFALTAPFTIWPKIWKTVKTAKVVHSSVSKDICRLFGFIALLCAVIQGKKSLCVMDIDHRHSAKMSYRTGELSLKSYLLCRYLYNPLTALQLRFATRYCNLCLLKGKSLADDFGKGRSHVKNFYNTAHDLSFVLTEQELQKRLDNCSPERETIELVYFGRIVQYKGIQNMIHATRLANEKLRAQNSHKTARLSIIGSGPIKDELKTLTKDLNMADVVSFYDAISYGKELFDKLKTFDFLLAAPKSEDTPRSVFDAMACGLPIIAFDTYYYKDLEHTGTVKTVPWLSEESMASKIIELSNDTKTTHSMIRKGKEFAENNTQDTWLNRRQEWTTTFLGDSP